MSSSTPSQPVHLPPELLQRLQQRAAAEHRTVDDLTADVVAAFLDEQDWLVAVDEGLKDIDEGRTVDGDEVISDWRKRIATSRASRST